MDQIFKKLTPIPLLIVNFPNLLMHVTCTGKRILLWGRFKMVLIETLVNIDIGKKDKRNLY